LACFQDELWMMACIFAS